MAESSTAVRAAIGILSIGDMGMGMAKLLRAHDYPVYTVASGRSQRTKDRIKAANITDLPSDEALVIECDIILSIVPPRDAVATARRVHEAARAVAQERKDRKGLSKLLFVDLNAVSPRTTKTIEGFMTTSKSSATEPSITRRLSRSLSLKSDMPPVPISIVFLDGGIIGGPPQQQPDKSWKLPSIVISGPAQQALSSELQSVLKVKIISDKIGSASALKASFAAMGKGICAIGIASYTTAHSAGVLPELRSHLHDRYPDLQAFVEQAMTAMAPKAYRWVDEMRQIGQTLADEGGLGPGHGGQAMFDGISEIYKLVADDTVLGKEVTGKRKRGTTVEDVVEAIEDGIEEKKLRGKGDEKLELAWRGSWT